MEKPHSSDAEPGSSRAIGSSDQLPVSEDSSKQGKRTVRFQDIEDHGETVVMSERTPVHSNAPTELGDGKAVPANSRIRWFYKDELYDEGALEDRMNQSVTHDSDRPAVIAQPNGKRLLLCSDFLRDLYDDVVHPFPGVSVDDAGVKMDEPFTPLYFRLNAMRERMEEVHVQPEDREDFAALEDYYQTHIAPSHRRLETILASGSVTFNALWALFAPGKLLYTKDDFDQPQLYRIGHSIYRQGYSEGGDETDLADQMLKSGPFAAMFGLTQSTRFSFDAWSITWDGATRTFSRTTRTFKINSFRGTRSITALPYYPLQYHNSSSNDADRERFLQNIEARGRLWKQYVAGNPVCRTYKGQAIFLEKGTINMTRSEPTSLNDRVIVDHDGAIHYHEPQTGALLFPPMRDVYEPLLGPGGLLHMFNTKTEQPVQGGDIDEAYASFDDVPADSHFEALQAQLSPSSVNCFSLTTRQWFAVIVDKLTDVEWSTSSLEHLVAPADVKDIIIRLVSQHRNQRKNGVVGDVIRGKGNGLVMVLHGPPGVGKTLTAESVAEFTQRPLYSINVGEVTSEQHVRTRLQQIFTEASRWNAVLLLDEADVVLEERSFEDIRRNGTVSIFLRMLEYYDGILFLTTNRLKHIDHAFQSRIHLAFQYKDLSVSSRRQIWTNFIERLPDAEFHAKVELRRKLDELQVKPLNGRQIRNVMFIAQSLAKGDRAEPGGLRFTHVQEALEQTATFQSYFVTEHAQTMETIGMMGDSSNEWRE